MPSVRYTVIDGEVIAEKRGGTRSFYVPDPLGNTVALINSSQTITDTFTYWPYGEEQSRTGTTATPFRYVGTAGYYRDSSTRSYVRARHLHTGQGRWMSEDPIGFDGGDFNLYRYVESRPTVHTDYLGLSRFFDIDLGKITNEFWPKHGCLDIDVSSWLPTLFKWPPPIYGNYCGPQEKSGGPPTNETDKCCQQHDNCFEKYKCTVLNQLGSAHCIQCNRKLCSCLATAPSSCQSWDVRCLFAESFARLTFMLAYACLTSLVPTPQSGGSKKLPQLPGSPSDLATGSRVPGTGPGTGRPLIYN